MIEVKKEVCLRCIEGFHTGDSDAHETVRSDIEHGVWSKNFEKGILDYCIHMPGCRSVGISRALEYATCCSHKEEHLDLFVDAVKEGMTK